MTRLRATSILSLLIVATLSASAFAEDIAPVETETPTLPTEPVTETVTDPCETEKAKLCGVVDATQADERAACIKKNRKQLKPFCEKPKAAPAAKEDGPKKVKDQEPEFADKSEAEGEPEDSKKHSFSFNARLGFGDNGVKGNNVATGIGAFVGADLRMRTVAVELNPEVLLTRMGQDHQMVTLRADGKLLFISIHDFSYRKDDTLRDLRALVGFGSTMNVGPLGRLSIAFGGAGLAYKYEVGGINPGAAYLGGFFGFNLYTTHRILKNELRASAMLFTRGTPPLNIPETTRTSSRNESNKEWFPAFTISERLYVPVKTFGPVTVGPEVRYEVNVLPEGTDSLFLIGARGSF